MRILCLIGSCLHALQDYDTSALGLGQVLAGSCSTADAHAFHDQVRHSRAAARQRRMRFMQASTLQQLGRLLSPALPVMGAACRARVYSSP